MTTKARGLRLSPDLEEAIAREAEASGKSWSAVTQELLSEAVKMRRAPGVVFVDGPSGRRAVVAGSGLDVWEIVAAWKECGKNLEKLGREFPWLVEPQLRAALAYYQLYPQEVEARLAREGAWTPERLRREHPALAAKPSRR